MDALKEIEMGALRPINAGGLVGEEGHWRYNACVNWAGDATELYVDGYRMAALKLVGELGNDQDFLVYPIIFLYRHYLELRLKRLIELGEALAPGEPAGVPKSHDLLQLWHLAEKHLRREYRTCSDWQSFKADLRAAKRLVDEFVRLDPGPSGTTFRYAREPNGRPTLPAHLIRINLRQFAAGMSHLAHFLDGAMYGLSAELDLKREYESEFGARLARPSQLGFPHREVS
jgi:hypothetical protein